MYGPPESYIGRLADLRGPQWPSRLVPTHVVYDVCVAKFAGFESRQWRITAYSIKDGTRCEILRNPTWLPRRVV